MQNKSQIIKDEIKELTKEYYESILKTKKENRKSIPVSGKIYDNTELYYAIEAVLDGWWTEGRFNREFENELKKYIGCKFAATVNSGSSANLISFMSLTSVKLGEKRVCPGDEIITVATSFPTTVYPIIQAGAIPVFVDVDLETYNINTSELKKAISSRTKGIFLAHTLGNPFNLDEIMKIKERYNLWLIEDTCDALGSVYDGKKVGSFGDLSTYSFYPAHHITTGEGGAVLTNNPLLNRIVRSMRDWGRDCWCPTGKDNTCNKRFGWKLGKLPYGYDHKYIYSEIGYNLKMTDLQAAIGVAQFKKLDKFNEIRRNNFNYLKTKLMEKGLDEYFILPKPTEKSDPAWFGFPLTIKEKYNNSIKRNDLQKYLSDNRIGSRLLFAGNITKQPVFTDYNITYRKLSNLKNTDKIMNDTFWVGIYQALNCNDLDKIVNTILSFVENKI